MAIAVIIAYDRQSFKLSLDGDCTNCLPLDCEVTCSVVLKLYETDLKRVDSVGYVELARSH